MTPRAFTPADDDRTIETAVNEGIVTVRELSRSTTQVFKALENRGRPILVTRHGRIIATIAPTTVRQVVEDLIANQPSISETTAADDALETGRTSSASEVFGRQ